MQEFGVRLLSCGPNRLRVLARVRPILGQSPAAARAMIDSGEPVLLAVDVIHTEAAEIVRDLRGLGATVEMFISGDGPDH